MIEELLRIATHDLVKKIAHIQEEDLKYWIEHGYERDKLSFCFYNRDPYHYSIRYENKILADRWLNIHFMVNGK